VKFLAIAESLARRFDADLFLADSGYLGEGVSFIGLEPCREMIVTDTTCKDEIAEFAFSDADPTFGFLSYSYGMKLRDTITEKRTEFPFGHLKKYMTVLEYDRTLGELVVHSGGDQPPVEIRRVISSAVATADFQMSSHSQSVLAQSLSREHYIDGVRKTLEYIREGYTYQLNLSIKFTIERQSLDPLSLFTHLYETYPAAFYAWCRSGQHQILSTSPERFLRVDGGRVLSQPIKGTLRFEQKVYDESLVRELTESPKESAELSMIVDLIRNDISLNCDYGSVRVDGHKSTFVVDNLVQMYSSVLGSLKSDRTCLDLLLDAFPGGSVTGCPKKKSMQIIDELEPHARDVYCGSFFVIKDRKHMDSSIAIRTGYYDTDTGAFHFFAGSGIVVDSDPEREYDETVAKAEKFLKVLDQ
jgi:para-aminobenzoate synthetase component 1